MDSDEKNIAMQNSLLIVIVLSTIVYVDYSRT